MAHDGGRPSYRTSRLPAQADLRAHSPSSGAARHSYRARTMEAVFCDLSSQVQDEPELKEKYLCAQAAYNQAKTRFELAQLLHKKEERDCMSKKHE